MLSLEFQVPSIVVLIGVSGAGKSSFARALFLPTEILSSDTCRALISDEENDQSVTAQAFDLLLTIARLRLARGRLCVVDATNLNPRDRSKYLVLGNEIGCPVSALVLDPGVSVCLARTAERMDRDINEEVVRRQHDEFVANLPSLGSEGYRRVWHLAGEQATASSVRVLRIC
jgi:protein phosphatase